MCASTARERAPSAARSISSTAWREREAYWIGGDAVRRGTRRQFALEDDTCSAAPAQPRGARPHAGEPGQQRRASRPRRRAERNGADRRCRAWGSHRRRTAERPRRSAPPTTSGAGTSTARLYGGACAASRRSSRTPASRSCAHSTWSTAVASDAISFMRVRGSAPLKYWPTRLRRSTAVPTYEHLGRRPAEQVDAGAMRQRGRQVPRCGAGRASRRADRTAGRCRCARPGCRPARSSACSTSTVARASSSARWVGGGGRAEQPRQRGQPHAGRLVAGEHPAGQPDRAQHRRSGPSELAALGGRAQEPDVEAGVVGDEHRAAGELQERTAAPSRFSAHRTPWP